MASLLDYLRGRSAGAARSMRRHRAPEWEQCNPWLMEAFDPLLTAALRDPALRMPTKIPLGDYTPAARLLRGGVVELRSCPHSQQMGCLLDGLERACGGPAEAG
jgi:hypothetical protein